MNNEFSVRVAICSVLAYRTLKSPSYLNIRLDKNDTFSIAKTLPGSFCTYFGKISPFVTDKIQEEKKEIISYLNDNTNLGFSLNEEKEEIILPYDEYLEVNSRDFLASLQRLVSINYNHQNPKLVHKGNYNNLDDMDVNNSTNETFSKYIEFFRLEKEENIDMRDSYLDNSIKQINKKSEGEFSKIKMSINNLSLDNKKFNNNNYNNYNNNQDLISDAIENSRNLISNEVIRGVCLCLKDYSSAVRETAANSLAHIALPESLGAVTSLIESLKDSDVVVKSKVLYAIGRIADGLDTNLILPHLIEALNTNFWKVKLACMKTLSEFGNRASKYALPILQKLLKESPINKQAIADTIVKLGFDGESILLKFLTSEDDSNFKMKSVIARAFSFTAVNSHNMDFIIETLFKTSNSDYSQIRISAVTAIRNLMEKSNENNTYLKRKNVIPFFYNKLTDKDLGIQTVL
jgi:HEAT repeat protein